MTFVGLLSLRQPAYTASDCPTSTLYEECNRIVTQAPYAPALP